MSLPYKKGSNGPEILAWQEWAYRYAKSYASLIGPKDAYFGLGEEAFVKQLQFNLKIPITGIFGNLEAGLTNFKTDFVTAPTIEKRRKIWILSSPGSGANGDLGPSHDLGERCQNVLRLNHYIVRFQIGGYLGVLGGSSTMTYNEVIWDQCKSKEYFFRTNKDAQEALQQARAYIAKKGWVEADLTDAQLIEIASTLEFEFHTSGYSQSADGNEEAMEYLFGDPGYVHPGDPSQTPSTGEFRILRHCLKRVVQFGNPSTPGTGISRKVRSAWLAAKVRNVNYDNDFYAKVPASDKIRPAFYAIIVQAEMELPFAVHVLRIAVPIILEYLKFVPVLGQVGAALGPFGPLAQLAVSAAAGISAGLSSMTSLFGQAASEKDKKVDKDLYDILIPMGILQNIPALLQLIGAVGPGLDAHNRYPFDPVKMNEAYDHIASFRR